MNAKEAYQQTSELSNKINSDQYGRCLEAIKKSIKNGIYLASVYEPLVVPVKERLENEGFKVNQHSYRNEYNVTISWDHAHE